MTAHSRDEDADGTVAEIVRVVQLCQASWGGWASVDDPHEQAALREAHRGYLQHLWDLLEPHLRRIAYHWIRSSLAPDVASLTQGMFLYVLEALPRIQLNPEKNPISYLMSIAWRGCYDEYGKHFDVRRVRRRTTEPDEGGAAADDGLRFTEELPEQLADSGEDLADEVADQLDEAAIVRAAHRFWSTLDPATQQIMEWRTTDPPRSFKEVAVALGPGWTEAATRKRWSRTMEATREHLRRRGLLGPEPA